MHFAFVPTIISFVSALVLVVHGFVSRVLHQENTKPQDAADVEPLAPPKAFWKRRAIASGGLSILLFKASRLLAVIALLGFSVYSAVNGSLSDIQAAFVITWSYAAALAILNVFSSATAARIFSAHLSAVTLTVFVYYAYRDILPLMTFTDEPADTYTDGKRLWIKVALVTFAGVVEPLLEPFPYVPVDPENPSVEPNVEQTASLFSIIFYVFLEHIIWKAYRTPHLAFDELPPQCDYDRARYLNRKAYPYLDPFSGAKRENLFWSILKAFKASFTAQVFFLICSAASKLASPIGTNRLLSYLENHGEGAIIKPWVWIIWIASGPLVGTIFQQLYIFISLRQFVRTEGIITSLVFDHALRIRMKAEVSKSQVQSAPATADPASNTPGPQTAATSTAVSSSSASTVVPPPSLSPQPPAQDSKDSKGAASAKKPPKKGDNLIGKINNLVTSDLSSIQVGRNFLVVFVLAPFQIIFSMWFLYSILGWSSIVGLVVMVVLLPVPARIARSLTGVQKAKMKATDARVQRVTEVMNSLRMIKLFGWERRVDGMVSEKREDELLYVWKRKLWGLGNDAANNLIPLVHMVVTFSAFTLIMKKELTASVVFSAITAFNMLRQEMYRSFTMLPAVIQGYVALGRLSDFLRNTELIDEYDDTAKKRVVNDSSTLHEDDIGCGAAHFTWTSEELNGAETPSQRTFRLRIDEELTFKKGAFNLIVGPTGSGKTSVLMALLREMHYVPLGLDSWINLPKKGGVAYAAQESWVLNDTIRGNILFGSAYNEERYKKTVYQCGLTRDIAMFEAGDMTEVGEKGITLSGGQKARVTLARAVYSNAEILLLDDVLAALDVHTSRWVVNKCFRGDLVKERTVLLVTHNIALAGPLAEFVVSLTIDGAIASQGSVSTVLGLDFTIAEYDLDDEDDEDTTTVKTDDDKEKDGKLVIAEEIELGHVSRKSFMLWFANLGNAFFWCQYLVASSMSEVCDALDVWWLGFWASQYALRDREDISIAFYLGVYCAIVLGVVVFNTYSVIIYTIGSMRASLVIHQKLMDALLGSTFRWLDVTPISRVITRCTQDIQTVDGPIANMVIALTGISMSMAVKLAAVVLYIPAFIMPSIFIGGLGAWLGQVYMKSQLSVKREMSNAKSPVLSVFNSAVGGLVSIRAYSAQNAFREESLARIDRYIRAARSFWNLNRWIAIRIDALSALFSASLAAYLVYGSSTPNPSVIGFVLAMAVSFSEMILWLVRIYNEFEVQGNSLERIRQYTEIDQEPQPREEGTPPAYWPASGELQVEGLSARYSSDGPEVLQNVSFHIKAGERIGVVGRTGSGKSTLTLALLRCIYTTGTVYFDGIATDNINLDALRSNITIIPQVPELLAGTLRQNLDMFAEYDDATLNDALRAAGLFSLQRLSDENRMTLETQIASGGNSLSVGQRQIIALARAIVRQSKLLILDEATSAIDYETDAVIQESLRKELSKDVSVITVAHRLQTIMDSDKIMVLDAGKLVEFETPQVLLRNEKSFLRTLVEQSADKDTLYAMVAEKASP